MLYLPDFNTPDFYLWGYLEVSCVPQQPSNDWWTENSNHSKFQGNPPRRHLRNWQVRASSAPTPRSHFEHILENVNFAQSDQDNFGEW